MRLKLKFGSRNNINRRISIVLITNKIHLFGKDRYFSFELMPDKDILASKFILENIEKEIGMISLLSKDNISEEEYFTIIKIQKEAFMKYELDDFEMFFHILIYILSKESVKELVKFAQNTKTAFFDNFYALINSFHVKNVYTSSEKESNKLIESLLNELKEKLDKEDIKQFYLSAIKYGGTRRLYDLEKIFVGKLSLSEALNRFKEEVINDEDIISALAEYYDKDTSPVDKILQKVPYLDTIYAKFYYYKDIEMIRSTISDFVYKLTNKMNNTDNKVGVFGYVMFPHRYYTEDKYLFQKYFNKYVVPSFRGIFSYNKNPVQEIINRIRFIRSGNTSFIHINDILYLPEYVEYLLEHKIKVRGEFQNEKVKKVIMDSLINGFRSVLKRQSVNYSLPLKLFALIFTEDGRFEKWSEEAGIIKKFNNFKRELYSEVYL